MLNIDLGPRLENFVRAQVESGRFQSATDVLRAALTLLEGQGEASAGSRVDLVRTVNEAFDDPRPRAASRDVFARLRAFHAERVRAERRGN